MWLSPIKVGAVYLQKKLCAQAYGLLANCDVIMLVRGNAIMVVYNIDMPLVRGIRSTFPQRLFCTN